MLVPALVSHAPALFTLLLVSLGSLKFSDQFLLPSVVKGPGPSTAPYKIEFKGYLIVTSIQERMLPKEPVGKLELMEQVNSVTFQGCSSVLSSVSKSI